MSGQTISLKDVLAALDSGRIFQSLSFITCDLGKDTGGELIILENSHKHNWLSKEDYKKQEKLQPTSRLLKKDPRHQENSTRNIALPNGQIRKVHIRLIRSFNGKTVL